MFEIELRFTLDRMVSDLGQEQNPEAWEQLREIIHTNDGAALLEFLNNLSSGDRARAISRLDQEDKNQLLVLLTPEEAASLLEELPDVQAKDLIEDLSEEHAAAIVGELPSDQQADLLGSLDEQAAEAILKEMDPEEAKDARQLLSYSPDTAGGLMITEYLSYRENDTVGDVLEDLRENAQTYARYDVLYAYILDNEGRLVGVLKLRDLLWAPRQSPVSSIMIREPICFHSEQSLDEMRGVFDRYDFFGVPVVDHRNRLVGLVRRAAYLEAVESRADKNFLAASGILGGEELRSLPVRVRSVKRLWFLIFKIFLNLISASVIAFFSDTLTAVIALAFFLPIISDLGGVSGNQALAVSIREMALGLVKPRDMLLVLLNELKLGVLIGGILGLLVGIVAYVWNGNIVLGMVVGLALILNTVIAVCLGGVMPLILKHYRIDPALASSGMVTFVTDACGFLFVLGFATLALHYLQG